MALPPARALPRVVILETQTRSDCRRRRPGPAHYAAHGSMAENQEVRNEPKPPLARQETILLAKIIL
jgi:hypothetical protein